MTATGVNTEAAARADADFARAMSVPEALLELRDDLPPKQWPSRDVALNRSVVVLTVAAWQGWVETYVSTTLGTMAEPPTGHSGDANFRHLLKATRPLIDMATREVERFSTPDATGVRGLLRLVGDDPLARWSFEVAGGRRDDNDVAGRLNDWVKVRHAIAHGAPHLPSVAVLDRTKGGFGSLTHRRAAQCVSFFRALAVATGRPS